MKKHFVKNISSFFLLMCIAVSSGCGPASIAASTTLTLIPSQTLIATTISNPTNTPEPIHPEGIIFYSDFNSIYSINLKSRKAKVLFDNSYPYFVASNYIYVRLLSEKSKAYEIFRSNFDGTELQQITNDGASGIFNVDPFNRYLTYRNGQANLMMLNLYNNVSTFIAKPNKSTKGTEWLYADSWSPDGKNLIYDRMLNPGADDVCSLFIYNIQEEKSTGLLSNKNVGCPIAWSPDGRNIALVSDNSKD